MTDLPTADAVVATVIEPARVPRPTLWIQIGNRSVRPLDCFDLYSTLTPAVSYEPQDSDKGFTVRIPGELEVQRAAKIDAAREAVIVAAKKFEFTDYGTSASEEAASELMNAVVALYAVEKEPT